MGSKEKKDKRQSDINGMCRKKRYLHQSMSSMKEERAKEDQTLRPRDGKPILNDTHSVRQGLRSFNERGGQHRTQTRTRIAHPNILRQDGNEQDTRTVGSQDKQGTHEEGTEHQTRKRLADPDITKDVKEPDKLRQDGKEQDPLNVAGRDKQGTQEDGTKQPVSGDSSSRSGGYILTGTWHDGHVARKAYHDGNAYRTNGHGGGDDGSGARTERQDGCADNNAGHDNSGGSCAPPAAAGLPPL